MPALNFTKFTEKVENGDKSITIRRKSKRVIEQGDKLVLYTGMRTKNCRKLLFSGKSSFRAEGLYPIQILKNGGVFFRNETHFFGLWPEQIQELAEMDGFDTDVDFLQYFTESGKSNFDGNVIVFGKESPFHDFFKRCMNKWMSRTPNRLFPGTPEFKADKNLNPSLHD